MGIRHSFHKRVHPPPFLSGYYGCEAFFHYCNTSYADFQEGEVHLVVTKVKVQGRRKEGMFR